MAWQAAKHDPECVSGYCRGRLVPGHCLIVPTEHVTSARQVDEHVWDRDPQLQKVPPSDVHGTGTLPSYLDSILASVLFTMASLEPPLMGTPIAQPRCKR